MPTMPLLLDGRCVAQERLHAMELIVRTLPVPPMLCIISVGDNAASRIYVRIKQRTAALAGMQTLHIALPYASQAQLHDILATQSEDPSVHAIILQLPLPDHLSARAACYHIAPHKDADALHPLNVGRLVIGDTHILPCTPRGILSLLQHYAVPLARKNITVLGRSFIVGTPLSLLLTQHGGTVTLCHKDSPDILSAVTSADIVVTATGQRDIFPLHVLPPMCVLIDVGILRNADGSLRGDVVCGVVPQHLHAYTPVPGGVGPMTVVSVLENTLLLYQHQHTSYSGITP